ncbi:hypothetical protein [Haloarcula salina]|uniref:SWIM-type domain-containing protein n=1 Tax=Haloarcula salina TaxID=1429914 RepID=A0AA41KDT0_9EURY|nr:hypothetical protein [Haloarcula salina]MBV0900177.1 hypothetical protein [Haloarcula salina]
MSTKDTAALQTAATAERIDDRTKRALEEYLTVTPDIGRARGADDLVLVTSASGKEYLVDVRGGSCECPDATHRDVECKHQIRAKMALGLAAVPAGAAEACDIDPDLGQHCDAELRFAAADGGVVSTASDEAADDVVDLSEEHGEAPIDGTCIAGHERCAGISGMYMGEFPCANCWLYAPASAHIHFHEATDNGGDL